MGGFYQFPGGSWAAFLSGECNTSIVFLEYLHENNISSGQIQNYLAALRAMHIAHGLETAPFKDERLSLFLKATRIQRPFHPKVLAHLDLSLLEKNINLCDHMQFPQVFKPLYIFRGKKR